MAKYREKQKCFKVAIRPRFNVAYWRKGGHQRIICVWLKNNLSLCNETESNNANQNVKVFQDKAGQNLSRGAIIFVAILDFLPSSPRSAHSEMIMVLSNFLWEYTYPSTSSSLILSSFFMRFAKIQNKWNKKLVYQRLMTRYILGTSKVLSMLSSSYLIVEIEIIWLRYFPDYLRIHDKVGHLKIRVNW